MKSVVITGASSGIGRVTAEHLAQRGWFVLGTVRKQSDADALQASLGSKGAAIIMDVRDSSSVKVAAEQVANRLTGKPLHALVNNAGVAPLGPLVDQPEDEIVSTIDINLTGTIRAIRAFAPLMRIDPAGAASARQEHDTPRRIVNITSVSGELGYPFGAVYAATKHAVEGLSKSLRRELMLDGIDVIVIGPGAVQTPIWDKELSGNSDRYAGTRWAAPMKKVHELIKQMDKDGLSPIVVAQTIEAALTSLSPSVRYAPVPNKLLNWWLPRMLPTRWLDRVFANRLGLHPTPPTKHAD